MPSGTTPSDRPHVERPRVIAHRCASFSAPQNSLRALQLALASCVDGVELDIRLTKDRKWVALQEPLKDEERAVMRVHELLYSHLRRDVVPLDSLLALFASYPKRELFITVHDIGEEKSLLASLHRYGLQENARIIAWEPEILRRVHQRDPLMRLGLVYVPLSDVVKRLDAQVVVPLSRRHVVMSFNKLHAFDATFSVRAARRQYLARIPDLPLYSIHPPALLCAKSLVRAAHERGIRVYPFGATKLNTLLLRHVGVDGFITSYATKFV